MMELFRKNSYWLLAVNYFHKEAQSQIASNKAKGKSQNGCNKKTKHAIFSEKRTFPASSEIRNVRFLENLACCFLVTPVLRFALLPYCQRDVPLESKYASEL